MPAIFQILWLCSVITLGLRSIVKFADEDFEAGMTYVVIIGLVILCTFSK